MGDKQEQHATVTLLAKKSVDSHRYATMQHFDQFSSHPHFPWPELTEQSTFIFAMYLYIWVDMYPQVHKMFSTACQLLK